MLLKCCKILGLEGDLVAAKICSVCGARFSKSPKLPLNYQVKCANNCQPMYVKSDIFKEKFSQSAVDL